MAVCGKGLQQRTTGCNLGDSRIYKSDREKFYQISQDHVLGRSLFGKAPLTQYLGMEEENLGYDIGMQGRQLYECAIMDTVVVLPEYRGMHLQYEMMQTAERKLRKEGYRYLLCTVHPENKFSRENVKRQGYKKMLTKEKYGGFLRDIWMKEL